MKIEEVIENFDKVKGEVANVVNKTLNIDEMLHSYMNKQELGTSEFAFILYMD